MQARRRDDFLPHRRGFFTYQEAAVKIGKIVEACFEIADIPAGTIGKVIRIEQRIIGCSLVVEWNYKLTPQRKQWPLEDSFGFYTYGAYLKEL